MCTILCACVHSRTYACNHAVLFFFVKTVKHFTDWILLILNFAIVWGCIPTFDWACFICQVWQPLFAMQYSTYAGSQCCTVITLKSISRAWKHILYGNPHRYPVMVSVMYTDTHYLSLLAEVDATASTVKDCWITSNHSHSNITVHTNTPQVLH